MIVIATSAMMGDLSGMLTYMHLYYSYTWYSSEWFIRQGNLQVMDTIHCWPYIVFFFLSLPRLYPWLYIWVTLRGLIRSGNGCLPYVRISVHPRCLVGYALLISLLFCAVCFVCLHPVAFECGMSILHCPLCFL